MFDSLHPGARSPGAARCPWQVLCPAIVRYTALRRGSARRRRGQTWSDYAAREGALQDRGVEVRPPTAADWPLLEAAVRILPLAAVSPPAVTAGMRRTVALGEQVGLFRPGAPPWWVDAVVAVPGFERCDTGRCLELLRPAVLPRLGALPYYGPLDDTAVHLSVPDVAGHALPAALAVECDTSVPQYDPAHVLGPDGAPAALPCVGFTLTFASPDYSAADLNVLRHEADRRLMRGAAGFSMSRLRECIVPEARPMLRHLVRGDAAVPSLFWVASALRWAAAQPGPAVFNVEAADAVATYARAHAHDLCKENPFVPGERFESLPACRAL